MQKEQILHLKEILDNLPICIDALDADGKIVFWNKECEKVTGYSKEEMIGNPNWMELLYPDASYRKSLLERWAKIGDNFQHWEMELQAKDGTKKIISWSNIADIFTIPEWETWAMGYEVTKYVGRENGKKQKEYGNQLQLLFEIQQDLRMAHTPEQVANTILLHLEAFTNATGGLVLMYDFEHQQAKIVAAKFKEKLFHHAEKFIPLDKLVHLPQAKQGQVIFIDDLSVYNDSIKLASLLFKKQGVKKAILVPLMDGSTPVGSLSLYTDDQFKVTEEDVHFLKNVGGIMAFALQQSRLIEKLQNTIAELEQETIRKVAELKRSERRLRAQYESIPIPTYTWQKSGDDFILINYNDMALAATYGKIGGHLGQKASEIYNNLPELVDLLNECYENEISIETQLKSIPPAPEEPHYFSLKLAYVAPDSVLMHIEDITDEYLAHEMIKHLQDVNRRQEEEIRWLREDLNAMTALLLPRLEEILNESNTSEANTVGKSSRQDEPQNGETLLEFWRKYLSLHTIKVQEKVVHLGELIRSLMDEQAELLRDFRIHIYLEIHELIVDGDILREILYRLLHLIVHRKPQDRVPVLRIISMPVETDGGEILLKFNGINWGGAQALNVGAVLKDAAALSNPDWRSLILAERLVQLLNGTMRITSSEDEGGSIEILLPLKTMRSAEENEAH